MDRFLPFAGQTSYQNTFVNYPSNPSAMIKPASHSTVIKDMKFNAKSSYSQDFKGEKYNDDPEIKLMILKNKRGIFKSPMNPDFPFLDETSTGFFYQAYKTKKIVPRGNTRKYDPIPSYEGQFMT
mmetsp:Transcript_14702/g.2127  ORF Transcript_14702/g.2127 Transcript_14702/m.2127 type:complete len:125 (-) Transcript_14702:128-502(-)